MRNRIIQVRHYSRKMMIMMLTGQFAVVHVFVKQLLRKPAK